MAHELKILQGGTTIDFSGTGYLIINYVPSTPDRLSSEVSFGLSDGGEISNVRYQNVRESAIVYFEGSLQSKINALETLFEDTRLYRNRRIGSKTYVSFKPDGDSTAYRSEILEGSVSLVETTMEHYANDSSEVVISWMRRYYWEGDETEIPLNNPNEVSKTTGGIEVANDLVPGSGLYNYVDIEDSDVEGVLPAPVKLTMTRTDATGDQFPSRWWFSNNAFGDPSNYSPMFQGEDAENLDSTGTDSNASGGEYGRIANSSGPAVEKMHTWTLSEAQVEQMKGRPHRILVRNNVIFTSKALQARIYKEISVSESLLGKSAEKLTSGPADIVLDLGSMRFPPTLLGDSQGDLSFQLWGRVPTGGSAANLDVDFVFLFPEDSFMFITQTGFSLDQTDVLTVNGYDDVIFMTKSDDFNVFTLKTDYLHVFPGRDQRIHYWHNGSKAGFSTVDCDMQIWYRPRRLTI